MLKAIICGINGKMGKTLVEDINQSNNISVAAGVDLKDDNKYEGFSVYSSILNVSENADIIIDFSRPSALTDILEYAESHNIGVVLATTGYTDDDIKKINQYVNSIPIFRSANMSLGVNLQIYLAKKAAQVLNEKFDIEIIEKHHNQKADSPSGTALMIAENINSVEKNKKEIIFGRHAVNHKRENEICIHAVRGGTIVGEHEVLFLGTDEALEITHRAYSKQIFAQGAIKAAEFLVNKNSGLYSMNDLLAGVFE